MCKRVEEEGLAHEWHFGGKEGKQVLTCAHKPISGLFFDGIHDVHNIDPVLILLRQVFTCWLWMLQEAALLYLNSKVKVNAETTAQSYHLMRKYRNLLRMFTGNALTSNMESLCVYVPHIFAAKELRHAPVVDSTEGGEGANKVFKNTKSNHKKSGLKNQYYQKMKKNHDRNLTSVSLNPNLMFGRLDKVKVRKQRKDKKDNNAADYLNTLKRRRSPESERCFCGKETGGGHCSWCDLALQTVMPMLNKGSLDEATSKSLIEWRKAQQGGDSNNDGRCKRKKHRNR